MTGLLESPSWLKDAPFSFDISNAAENIQTLQDPDEFFKLLLSEIDNAKERIYWSSLYFGNGQLENNLTKKLLGHMKKESRVCFRGLFDYCRGLRGASSSNTVGMFLPIVASHPDRASVYLFKSPFFRGLKSFIPQRYNEIFSVHHMKIYVFDSTVILSGANLSDTYFTNRQDRYVVIRNCPALAQFCCDVVDTLGSLSFCAQPDGSLKPTNLKLVDPKDTVALQRQGNISLRSLLDRYAKKFGPVSAGTADTVIYPFLQSAPLNIRDEEHVTEAMLRGLPKSDTLVIATSYFNLTKSYQQLLLHHCPAEHMKIYVSSPRSNGFFNGTGPSQFIPHGYIYFSRKFNDQVVATNQEKRIELYEYERDSWTFHSKGLWLCSKNSPLPYASFIGSTNFSFRSVNRDQEAQFVLLTSNMKVRQRLRNEIDDLATRCSRLNKAVFARPDHKIARWVPLAAKIARYFF